MAFFRKRKKTLLGVDADHFSLSMLELEHGGHEVCLNAFCLDVLSQENRSSTDDNEEGIPDLVTQGRHIETLIKKGKFAAKQAVSAVPGSSVITKKLSFDASMTDDEIENQIILDAEKLIPFPIDEVAMDFEIIGKNRADDEKVDVLLVVCRKQVVDDRESLLALAGLHPCAIDVVPYAMERAYALVGSRSEQSSSETCTGLIHLGDQFITLNIMHKDKSIYVGSGPSGILQLVEKICQQTGERSENVSRCLLQQKLPEGCDQKIAHDYITQTTLQINRLLEQFYSSGQGFQMDRIVLSGNVYKMDAMQSKLQEITGIHCTLANPFSGMKIAGHVDARLLERLAPAFFIACGLAMREVA